MLRSHAYQEMRVGILRGLSLYEFNGTLTSGDIIRCWGSKQSQCVMRQEMEALVPFVICER